MKLSFRVLALLVVAGVLLAGCKKDKPTHTVRFYVENNSAGHTGVWSQPMTLPESGLTYYVKPDPLITEANITNIQLVQVQSGHYAYLFHLDDWGTRHLYRASVSDMGRMLILSINGLPVGARQLDGAINDGRLYMFTELSNEEMEKLYLDLVKNTQNIQDMKRHHGY